MRLTRILANQVLNDGQPNGPPYQFLLVFEDGSTLRLRGASDGWRLIIDDQDQALDAACDLTEYGQIIVKDRSDLFDSKRMGLEITSRRSLHLRGEEVGLQLDFEEGHSLLFWVNGDELHSGDAAAMAAQYWVDGIQPAVART